jgi:hypothetical protein
VFVRFRDPDRELRAVQSLGAGLLDGVKPRSLEKEDMYEGMVVEGNRSR